VFPHPPKLELIDTGHAAGYTAVHWSPKRSCDARKPRSTTNSGSKGPRVVAAMTEGFVVDSPDRPDWTPAPLPARLADAIDRRSSNTTAGTGKVPMTTRIPRSAKHTAVTAPIAEAVREITRRVFGDSWTSVIRGGGGAS